MPRRIVRYPDLLPRYGIPYSNTHLARLEAEEPPLFPRRRKLNPAAPKNGSMGWDADEVEAWLDARLGHQRAAE